MNKTHLYTISCFVSDGEDGEKLMAVEGEFELGSFPLDVEEETLWLVRGSCIYQYSAAIMTSTDTDHTRKHIVLQD